MLGLLAVIDLALLPGAAWYGVHPAIAMTGHLLATLIATLLAFRASATRRVAAMVGLALGPAGVLCGIILSSIVPWPRGSGAGKRTMSDTQAVPVRGAGTMVARLLDGRVHHPEPESLGSLITILRSGTIDERRGALEAAVRNFDPRLSPVVARALTDDDQTIRALAAAAAAQIAQRLAEERTAYTLAAPGSDSVERIGGILWDHSRFDILLSDTQRDQIARDVSAQDADRQAIMTLNDRWKAHDFAAMDRICAEVAAGGNRADPALLGAARWWAQQSC